MKRPNKFLVVALIVCFFTFTSVQPSRAIIPVVIGGIALSDLAVLGVGAAVAVTVPMLVQGGTYGKWYNIGLDSETLANVGAAYAVAASYKVAEDDGVVSGYFQKAWDWLTGKDIEPLPNGNMLLPDYSELIAVADPTTPFTPPVPSIFSYGITYTVPFDRQEITFYEDQASASLARNAWNNDNVDTCAGYQWVSSAPRIIDGNWQYILVGCYNYYNPADNYGFPVLVFPNLTGIVAYTPQLTEQPPSVYFPYINDLLRDDIDGLNGVDAYDESMDFAINDALPGVADVYNTDPRNRDNLPIYASPPSSATDGKKPFDYINDKIMSSIPQDIIDEHGQESKQVDIGHQMPTDYVAPPPATTVPLPEVDTPFIGTLSDSPYASGTFDFYARFQAFITAVQSSPLFALPFGIFDVPTGGSSVIDVDMGSYGQSTFDLADFQGVFDILKSVLLVGFAFLSVRIVIRGNGG